MSLLVRSALMTVSRRGLSVTAARRAADLGMPDPVEHATGLEKYELLAKQAGNDDPFFLKAIKRGKVRICHVDSTLLTLYHPRAQRRSPTS